MGAYRSKPVTEKVSDSGEYCIGKRKIVYGATAMQGWRVSMEVGRMKCGPVVTDCFECDECDISQDAHCVVPDFDEGSSFFGVYDGHGGKHLL